MTDQLPIEPNATPPEGAPQTPPTNAAPQPKPEPTPTAGGNQPEPGKTFSQDDLDRIVRERLERERQKYADYDTSKAELAELRQAEEERKQAQMSELEKLQAKVDAEAKARETAEAERTRIEAEAASERLKYAIMAKAAELEFEHPEDVYHLADLASVKRGEDGAYQGLEEAVKALEGRLPKKNAGRQPKPKIEPTNPGSGGQPGETDAQKRARIFGSSQDAFDPAVLRQKGGGAFIVEKE